MEQLARFYLKMPARHRNLELLSRCIDLLLTELPDPTALEQLIYGIKLAVHEVASNVIEHAYGHEQGEIEITLQFEPHNKRFMAKLYDTGGAFDASQAPSPNLDIPQESGYGLFLAQQMMDEVSYQRQLDGNHWQLVKHL